MVNKQWILVEERYLWLRVVPYTHARAGVDIGNRERSWTDLAAQMKRDLGAQGLRDYNKPMLYEHFYQRKNSHNPPAFAVPFIREYRRKLADSNGLTAREYLASQAAARAAAQVGEQALLDDDDDDADYDGDDDYEDDDGDDDYEDDDGDEDSHGEDANEAEHEYEDDDDGHVEDYDEDYTIFEDEKEGEGPVEAPKAPTVAASLLQEARAAYINAQAYQNGQTGNNYAQAHSNIQAIRSGYTSSSGSGFEIANGGQHPSGAPSQRHRFSWDHHDTDKIEGIKRS